MEQINVIGIGQGKKDLTRFHLDLIMNCDMLVGGTRHLEMFDLPETIKILPIKGPLKPVIQTIKDNQNSKKIVVLASGDPLFYGIGAALIRHFGKDHITVHSNISSVSAAFAAIKEPWHDALVVSLHGRDIGTSPLSESAKKIAFLTDPKRNPAYIAQYLLNKKFTGFDFCVLENLGDSEKQKITWFDSIEPVLDQSFSDPNIVILLKREPRFFKTYGKNTGVHAGMADSLFKHSKGLITKSEIRSISLSKLKLTQKNLVVWDIGSGSGSVSIEVSCLVPDGMVYAIEKNPSRLEDIHYNIEQFARKNIKAVHADFPSGVDKIDHPPDRIFIGGGGKNLNEIINVSCEKLKPSGVIVINTVLIQNFQTAFDVLQNLGLKPEAAQIQVSKSRSMPYGIRFEALNPVFIIRGEKLGQT